MRCETGDVGQKTGEVRQDIWDRTRETGDVRQKTGEVRQETSDVRQETRDVRKKTGDMRREGPRNMLERSSEKERVQEIKL